MRFKSYSDELGRALQRADAADLTRQIDAYANHYAESAGGWPDELADDFNQIENCHYDDPEKALAYVILAASRSDDAAFLRFLACGTLENILRDPSDDMLERIVAEARKSPTFRWLLSNPFKAAVAPRAWQAIETFRLTGAAEEPSADLLPSRHLH